MGYKRAVKSALRVLGLGTIALPLLGVVAQTACVPSGNAPPYDAGVVPMTAASTFKPSSNVMTAPFEDDFDRPAKGKSPSPAASASGKFASILLGDAALGADGGADAGDAGSILLATDAAAEEPDDGLGPDWAQVRTNAWAIENGRLCVQNAHNHGIWLKRTLPVNARIEFDAVALTDEGDLKAEVWGDGKSAATGTSYTNATSYLTILGGWKNTIHAIARLNEHGTDRKEIRVEQDSDDPRQRTVNKGQLYHFKIERTDGKTIRWFVDGLEYLSWADPSPLAGAGHDHFGFNEWEAKVCFDNVKVTPL